MWYRARFETACDDPRPVEFPPTGPYWVTGQSADDPVRYTIVAYFTQESDIMRFWPEAEDIEMETVNSLNFTSRFPVPQWWVTAEKPEPVPSKEGHEAYLKWRYGDDRKTDILKQED